MTRTKKFFAVLIATLTLIGASISPASAAVPKSCYYCRGRIVVGNVRTMSERQDCIQGRKHTVYYREIYCKGSCGSQYRIYKSSCSNHCHNGW